MLAKTALDSAGGKEWSEFYQAIESKVYFRPALRDAQIPFAEKAKQLPASPAELVQRDIPMRSTMRKVFQRLGLEGKWFSDCVELYLGDYVEAMGVHVIAGQELEQGEVDKVLRAVRESAAIRYLMSFVKDPARQDRVLRRIFPSGAFGEGQWSLTCDALFVF